MTHELIGRDGEGGGEGGGIGKKEGRQERGEGEIIMKEHYIIGRGSPGE